jgi:thiamine-phosphate pyrophosphorylase
VKDKFQVDKLHLSLEHSPCPAFVAEYEKLNTQFPILDKQKLKFYPVVDSLSWVEKLAKLGVKTIQLRLKNKSFSEIEKTALVAKQICEEHACQFFLNDYWQIAAKLNLFGVHLGFEDLQSADLKRIEQAGLCLGLSTHSYFELAVSIALQPSYIALGPIYPTTLKQMRFAEQGVQRITEWRGITSASIPLVAIGGITLESSRKIYQAGADSIAVVSDVTLNSNPDERVRAWLDMAAGLNSPN